MSTTRYKQAKESSLNIRISQQEKATIVRAAKIKQMSLSDFIISNACEVAKQIIAEETNVVMPPEQWQAFCQALDSPPKRIPALAKLLNSESVFNE